MPVERSSGHPTLGYVTVKQAPNGVIHLLTTITRPCLHYEFNESWIWSDARDITPESSGGTIREFVERYPNGQLRSRWTARICANGRYLLHGEEIDYYEDGSIQHTVCYKNGRKTGEEIYWLPDGTKAWSWHRNLKTNVGVWTHYWKNGKKKIESTWILRPEVPVLKRTFSAIWQKVLAGTGTNRGSLLPHIILKMGISLMLTCQLINRHVYSQ